MQQRLTQLEAVNTMLLGIRLMPAATIDHLDVYTEGVIARSTLRRKTLEVLSRGWNFNTRRLKLPVDTISGKVLAPTGTIDIYSPTGSRKSYGLGSSGKVIDLDTNEAATEPVDVIVVMGYPWEDLPVTLQMLALNEARLEFKLEMKSKTGPEASKLQGDIADSLRVMRLWDSRQRRANMLDNAGMRLHVNQRARRVVTP